MIFLLTPEYIVGMFPVTLIQIFATLPASKEDCGSESSMEHAAVLCGIEETIFQVPVVGMTFLPIISQLREFTQTFLCCRI